MYKKFRVSRSTPSPFSRPRGFPCFSIFAKTHGFSNSFQAPSQGGNNLSQYPVKIYMGILPRLVSIFNLMV